MPLARNTSTPPTAAAANTTAVTTCAALSTRSASTTALRHVQLGTASPGQDERHPEPSEDHRPAVRHEEVQQNADDQGGTPPAHALVKQEGQPADQGAQV